MDGWLAAVEADSSDKSLADKIVDNRPAEIQDKCSQIPGVEQVVVPGIGKVCENEQVQTRYGTPVTVAGESIATDTNQCQLKPLQRERLLPDRLHGRSVGAARGDVPDGRLRLVSSGGQPAGHDPVADLPGEGRICHLRRAPAGRRPDFGGIRWFDGSWQWSRSRSRSPRRLTRQVPNPTVEGPIEGGVRGYPWNKSLFDLEKPDYSEKEYFFGGVATNLSSGLTAPYKSRMLVRLPRDPKDFSGTVTVEWLNVTGQNDLETSWPPAGEYMMEQGVGYVGVSAQLAGVCCGPTTLKGWDATRYATLVHPGDEFSFDIFSQAIEALSDPAHNATTPGSPKQIDPMLGLEAEHIVANGASQSAGRLTTHVNDGYNRGGIDLYTITRGGGPYDDFSTPIFQLNEEGLGELQPDSDSYRAWEEAGTAHAPAAWWNYVWAELQRDHVGAPAPDALNVACAVNRGSVDYSARALAFWTEEYFKNGTLPPSVPRIERDENGDVVRDEHGAGRRRNPASVHRGAGGPQRGRGLPAVGHLQVLELGEDQVPLPDARRVRRPGQGLDGPGGQARLDDPRGSR